MTSAPRDSSSLLFCQEADIDAITNEREQVEEMIDLKAALARLTPKQRFALGMWAQGYTLEQIGTVMKVTKQAVGRLIQRCARSP